MNILVIGGAGYIGSHAVRKLLDSDYHVVVLDNLITGHRKAIDPRAKFYQVDLLNTFLVSKILRNEKIDAVMHFAAYSLVSESVQKPLLYYQNNITGMISLLNAMNDAKVKYLIFSSSAATYGIPEKLPITEEAPLKPINPYGETKMMMEKMMLWADKANNIKSIALRYYILKCADSHDKIFTIYGNDYQTLDGTNVRDYVEIEDLIDAHILALQHLIKTNLSDVFNLGTAHGYSNLEILECAKRITATDIPYKFGPRRGGDPDSLVADSTKARTILGWQPKHENIDNIIASAWKWHQKHPNGYED